jgi:DUF971 family protein
MNTATQAVRIMRRDPSRIAVEWADGRTTSYLAPELRKLCPCAQCVSETTGQRLLDLTSVGDDMTQVDVRIVGNYAITVQFSDGHATGIFTYPYLRENDPGR